MQTVFEKSVFFGGHRKSKNIKSILLKFCTVFSHVYRGTKIKILYLFRFLKICHYFKVKKRFFKKKILALYIFWHYKSIGEKIRSPSIQQFLNCAGLNIDAKKQTGSL